MRTGCLEDAKSGNLSDKGAEASAKSQGTVLRSRTRNGRDGHYSTSIHIRL